MTALELVLAAALCVAVDLPDDPLHRAAYQGDQATVAAELARGAPVNARSLHDWTPLHCAAIGGHEAIARMLLEHGADPDARAEFDLTPLHWATLRSHEAVIAVLASRGATLGARSLYGMTPLHLVGTKAAVEALVEAGAKVDTRDDRGLTPLSTSRTKEAGQALMARGADIHIRGNDGRTLFDMLVVNTVEESHGLILFGRRDSARLRGDEAEVAIRVLNVWPVTRSNISLHVETPGADSVDPPLLTRLDPGQMATLTTRLRRRPEQPEGRSPFVAQLSMDGEPLDVFKLELDSSRKETAGDRGFARLGGAELRTTPSRHYQLLLLAAPVLVLAGWWWSRRRAAALKHSPSNHQ